MTPLAELQLSFARALLDEQMAPHRRLFARAPVPAAAALEVHRRTVLSGLCRTLALSFPTVKALMGERWFDQAARAYVAIRPPAAARLAAYGSDFPDFLDGYALAAAPSWLGELARLDVAIAQAASAPSLATVRPIDRQVAISLPVSLRVLELDCAADLVRDAVEAGDEHAIALADPEPGPRWLAIWRSGGGAAARPLSPPAGAFLRELLAGVGPEAAMQPAAAEASWEAALMAVQAEVFAAPFAQIIQTSLETDPP